MAEPKTILALCGSTRAASTNLTLIHAVAALAQGRFSVVLEEGLTNLPHFNPDLDTAEAPETVTAFRQRLRAADGVLICTPEYAMGVPGTLKNALDWTVSSCEFYHKPTALITASAMGEKGHDSLLETLKVLDTRMTDATRLLIFHARTKVNAPATITDAAVLEAVQALIEALAEMLKEPYVSAEGVAAG